MALQIWLPLRGDLKNLGLCNSTLTLNGNTTPVVDNNGKIGKCYTFTDGYILGTQNFMTNNVPDWSYCAWIKIASYHNGCLFTCRDAVTSAGFAIFHYGSSTHWLFDDGDRWNFDSTIELPLNTWTHVAFVRKKGSYKKFYVNGVLAGSNTSTHTPTNVSTTHFTIGKSQQSSTYASANNFQGQMNDVRIYDHALSAKEVKEISKALVCHYPLDNNGIGNPNIARNTANGTGWQYSTFDKLTRTFTRSTTATTESYIVCWGNNGYHSLTVGTTYTFSAEYKTNDQIKGVEIYAYTNDTQNIQTKWYPAVTEWSPITLTFTPKSGYNWNNCTIRFDNNGSNTEGVEAILYVRNIKLEEGSKATAWCPNSNDPEYASFFSADILLPKDISGYNNNAITNVDTTISSDSPRYLTSTVFNGTSSRINIDQGAKVKDQITINLWGYMDDWITPVTQNSKIYRPISCAEGGGWSFRPDDDKTRFRMSVGVGTSSNSYIHNYMPLSNLTSGWHMLSLTYNGLRSRIYLDGNFINEAGSLTTKTPLFYNATNYTYIGTESTASSFDVAGCFPGKISDVRIYATALSDADIKELYSSSASIDDEGNMYGYDFTEENIGKVSIERDGLVKTECISEFIVNTFDKTLYAEPDRSAWIRIFHHNNPGADNLFSSTDTFTSQVYKDQNKWFNISLCNLLTDSWELMVKQKTSSSDTEAKYRWIQSYNPMTAAYDNVTSDNVTKITTTGYSSFDYCGGLWRKTNDENTYLRQAGTSTGNWHGAMGAWNVSPSGGNRLPGFNFIMLENTGYMDLYLRVDNINLNKTSFAKDFLKTNELHEI